MPKIRECNQSRKIKNQGKRKNGKPMQQRARRVMTAKLKKELAQQKRGGSSVNEQSRDSSAITEAVDQVEQTTEAAVHESGHQVKRGVFRAVTKAKKERQKMGVRQSRPQGSVTGRDIRPPEIPEQQTPAPPETGTRVSSGSSLPRMSPGNIPRQAPASQPPSPGNRMLQQAVNRRRELAQHPEWPGTTPAGSSQSTQGYYSKSTAIPGAPTNPKENLSPKNQSINPSIKERPRRSFLLREKPPGGAFTPRARPKAGQAIRNATVPTNGKQAAANLITSKARQKIQREAQRSIFQRTKQTAKTTTDLSKRAALATAKAVKTIIGALSALMGGTVLAAALCVIFLVAAVIASPFGILFANEPSPGAVPLNAAVSQINMELTDKLVLLQSGAYDSIDIQGTGPDWREVAAVFACKTAMGTDGVDVAALTPDRVDRLKAVFWDMCAISTSLETIDHPATGGTAAWTENILHITITAKTADDMRTVYPFNNEQNRALTELLAELDMIGNLLGNLSVSQDDATELLRRLPKDLSSERRAVVETACKLVGKVNYFWGGKSRVIGWDSRWGTIQKVGAAGNSTSGTYRPFGLDCSGFVDWVFYNISGGSYVLGHGGGAHTQHIYCIPITWAEAQPGDLVFYPDDTHVGIVGGRDESGNIQIVHCASNYNNVVITGKAGFAAIGRPQYYSS